MKKLLVFLILIATALLLTNPTEAEFRTYVQAYISTRVKAKPEETSLLKSTLENFLVEVGGKLTIELTETHNYYLFTIYKVKLEKQEPYKFLGIGKNFLPLQTEEPFKYKK